MPRRGVYLFSERGVMHLTHPAHDVESERQASADEIKITPEMVDAGLWAWIEADEAFETKEVTVKRIFRAMLNRSEGPAASVDRLVSSRSPR